MYSRIVLTVNFRLEKSLLLCRWMKTNCKFCFSKERSGSVVKSKWDWNNALVLSCLRASENVTLKKELKLKAQSYYYWLWWGFSLKYWPNEIILPGSFAGAEMCFCLSTSSFKNIPRKHFCFHFPIVF